MRFQPVDPPHERQAAVARLLDYYLNTARTASRHLARRTAVLPDTTTAVRPAAAPDLSLPAEATVWMKAERANLFAAATYAIARGMTPVATALPAAMHGYLRHHEHGDQALALYRRAVDLARGGGDWLAEANALTDIGDIQFLKGDFQDAESTLRRAIELHADRASPLGEAHALSILGTVLSRTGDNIGAAARLETALNTYRDIGDRFGEACALGYLGEVQLMTGQFAAATDGLTQALELLRGLGICQPV